MPVCKPCETAQHLLVTCKRNPRWLLLFLGVPCSVVSLRWEGPSLISPGSSLALLLSWVVAPVLLPPDSLRPWGTFLRVNLSKHHPTTAVPTTPTLWSYLFSLIRPKISPILYGQGKPVTARLVQEWEGPWTREIKKLVHTHTLYWLQELENISENYFPLLIFLDKLGS